MANEHPVASSIVTVEELVGRTDIVLCDVRWYLDRTPGRSKYNEGHIPGQYLLTLTNFGDTASQVRRTSSATRSGVVRNKFGVTPGLAITTQRCRIRRQWRHVSRPSGVDAPGSRSRRSLT